MNSWERIELNTEPDVKINLIVFLDDSASMKSTWDKTIEGIQEYFSGLVEQPNVKYKATLHCFSNSVNTIFKEVGLDAIESDRIGNLRATGVSTSLYDSVGTELKKLGDSKAAHLIVILTDGKDNSSETWTAAKVAELRNTLQSKGNFTFVFLGANPDVWEEAGATASQANTRIFGKDKIASSLSELKERTNVFSSRMSFNANSDQPLLRSAKSVKNFYEDDSLGAGVPKKNT